MAEINQIIGKRIAKLRKEQNLKQADVAKLLETDAPAISKIENGSRRITIEQLLKLSIMLKVKPEVFYAGIIKPKSGSLGFVIKEDHSIYTKSEWEAVQSLLALPSEMREELAKSFKMLAKTK